MRIFIGIDLDAGVRSRIEAFVESVRHLAPDVRWTSPESWHITLKFIGEQSVEQVAAITERLRAIERTAFAIHASGLGFFPTAKAARVFWIGVQADPALNALAATIDSATAKLGIARDERSYSPHLTLARAGGRSGSPRSQKGDAANTKFVALQERIEETSRADSDALDFGVTLAREFILYQSQISPRGSVYSRMQRFPLRTIGTIV
jgi:RNA 2',3'-cyclic 3'-phosphodiesterase